ncbi:hypothetical protein NPA08_02840 [Mycoplasmopsis citelli]|uniref:hypothetical protein n=1 Tax=Mycoplasmopsis citelli TaxID=171281 RepID=UPI00211518A8|nr:hypothetical protein [Mycoplasmopsis citelli]UUD35883.1 hypothetical protein NPA08_02840 [Mycoplasmopsis citelli]
MKTKSWLKLGALSVACIPVISASCANSNKNNQPKPEETQKIKSFDLIPLVTEKTSFKDALGALKDSLLSFLPLSFKFTDKTTKEEKDSFENFQKQFSLEVEQEYNKIISVIDQINDKNFYQLNDLLSSTANDLISRKYNIILQLTKNISQNGQLAKNDYVKNFNVISKNYINTLILWEKTQIQLIKKQVFPLIDKALMSNKLTEQQKNDLNASKPILDEIIKDNQKVKEYFLKNWTGENPKDIPPVTDKEYKDLKQLAFDKSSEFFNKFSTLVSKTFVDNAQPIKKSFILPRFTWSDFFNPKTEYQKFDLNTLKPDQENQNLSIFGNFADSLRSFISEVSKKENFVGDNSYLNDLKPDYSAKFTLSDSKNAYKDQKPLYAWIYKKENGKYPTNKFTEDELKAYDHKLSDVLNNYDGDYLVKITLPESYLQFLGIVNSWTYPTLEQSFIEKNPNAQNIIAFKTLTQYQFIPEVSKGGELNLRFQFVNKDFKPFEEGLAYFGFNDVKPIWGYLVSHKGVSPKNVNYDFYISLTKEQYNKTFGSVANLDKLNSSEKPVITKTPVDSKEPKGLQNLDFKYGNDLIGSVKVNIIV